MPVEIKEFTPARITNLNIKFKGEDLAEEFGCVGQIEGETEMLTVVKKCEGIEVRSKSSPQKMTLKITGHVKVAPLRKIFGLSNEGLKAGVYSYGSDSKSKDFSLSADVIDVFDETTKLIAFPNCTSSTGLTISIENGADEVAEMELEFTAMVDNYRKCYYEAMIEDIMNNLGDEADFFIEEWRKNFTSQLPKAVSTPTP
nr:phage tail protein [Heyndrickxia oleronia]